MEASVSADIWFETENSNLEHKVDEVDQNVDNLSKQEVEQMKEQVGEMERKDEFEGETNIELQTGFRILKDLMADSNKNVNWPFMDPINVSAPDLVEDYYEKIEKPVWLKLMKEKFLSHQYTSITQFVSDFRLMLENCYRYNGPDHYVSKRGQKLETMLEQKLALLSRELRAKTSISATSGHFEEDSTSSTLGLRRRQKTMPRHDSTLLLNQLREEELQREKEYRRQIVMDRKAEKEALALEVLDWEDKVLFQGKYKEQMEVMWELPQIGLFLFLCQVPLNVGEIMQFDLERCLMMPRESSTMQLIMTSLLSTPFQRQKIDKKTLMPYKVWHEKLKTRVQHWYKIFIDSGMDAEKAGNKLGFEQEFFTVVGQTNPMERKRFHELSFYQRVWIVKSLCDYCMHTQDYLRDTVENQSFQDQREYMLGTDGDGWRYLHFPQFCGADVRIYKQAPIKYPKIEIKPDPFDSKRKFPLTYKPPPCKKQKVVRKKKKQKKKRTPPVSPVARQRPEGLRQTPKTVIPLQLIDSSSSTSTSSDEDEESADEIQEKLVDNSVDMNNDTNEATDINDEGDEKDESETDPAISDDEKKSADGHSTGSDATIPYCDNSCSDSVNSSRTCSRASSPCFTQDSVSQDTRFDSSRENSASPMIDGHMLRKFKKGARLKDLPNSRAARNLNSFLFMEDSNSRSSDCGDNSNSGIPVFKGKLNLKDILTEEKEYTSSSGAGDDSNSCDMKNLFKNSSVDTQSLNSAIDENQQDKLKTDSRLEEDMDTSVSGKSCVPSDDKIGNCSDTEQKAVKSECFSDNKEGLERDNLIPETDKKDVHVPDENDGNECKGKATACSRSNEPILFRNSNGYIHRSENRAVNGSDITKEVSKKEVCNIENDEKEVKFAYDVEKDTDPVSGNGSDLKGLQNHIEKENIEEEKMEIDKAEFTREHIKLSSDNISLGSKTNFEAVSDDSRSKTLQMGNTYENNSQMTDKNFNDIGTDSTISLHEEKVSVSIKQEKDVFEHAGDIKSESNTDSEKINHEDHRMAKELTDNMSENEVMDMSKVKTEINGAEPEMKPLNAEGPNNASDEKYFDKLRTEIKEEKTEDKVGKIKDDEEKTEKKVEEEEEEITPDMESFKLIVDSVEGLRELTNQFAEPEPVVIKRGKKEQINRPPPRKRCVELLYKRLSYLLKELEPWEAKLTQATKRARIKLRKEMEDFVEKEEEEPSSWDTDEETESGSEASGNENENSVDTEKRSKITSSPVKLLKGRNSECSTPVRFEDSSEEIDISQRGRLRKRRIIPNNVEDQNPVKKSKVVVKSESSSQQSQGEAPGQAGKIMIGYSELIRQLKAVNPAGLQGTNSPILLQTSQGGKVLVTSIVPTGPKAQANSQNLMIVSQSSDRSIRPVPITMGATSSVKQSQHPTIQHLLAKPQTTESSTTNIVSATVPATSGLRHILPQTTSVIQGASPSVIMRQVAPVANQSKTPVKTPIILKPNTTVTPQKVVLSYPVTPQKTLTNNQSSTISVMPQQVVTAHLPVVVTSPLVSVSPQLAVASQQPVSMGTVSKGKVKYYAANASTLPINVVQQLLATRGAKLQTGPNNQSILFIPMESEGSSRSVISVSKAIVQNAIGSTVPANPSGTQSVTISAAVTTISLAVSHGSVSQTVNNSVKVVTTAQAVSNALVSAAVNTLTVSSVSTVKVSSVNAGPPANLAAQQLSKVSNPSQSSSVPVTQNLKIQTDTIISGTSSSSVKVSETSSEPVSGVIKTLYYSPPKYPTNETVRTLLFKRKSSAEEKDKSSLPSPETSGEKSSSDLTSVHGKHFQKISPKPPALTVANPVALQQVQVPLQQISPNQNLILAKTSANQLIGPTFTVSNQNAQQCVFTSISASKLNTLLLQTSAAGAKSIPSLIKLPSKAALDSAVKAVVTSVNVTLPTVNIKVPSPTSLPSIGPRRNVTKTIQTMKSPIPVAPKVVTQSAGSVLGTSMSVANSNMLVSSSTLPLVSVAGQTVGLGTRLTNLIPAQQIQVSPLPVVTLASQVSGLSANLLQAVRAQLGSNATISVAGQSLPGQGLATAAPVVSVAGVGSGQGSNLGQLTQSLSGIVQNIDGKNVLTKMIPQTILTSQGVVQGFIAPQHMGKLPAKKPVQTGTPKTVVSQTVSQTVVKQEPQTVVKQESQSVKINSEAVITSHSKVSNIISSTTSVNLTNLTPPLQYVKVLAGTSQTSTQAGLSAAGVISRPSVPLMMAVPKLKSPSLSTVTVPSTTIAVSTPVQSSQQTGKFIFPPNLSALAVSASTSNLVSPLLNVPSALLVPGSGGMQVASPVLNQLGFPLLQSGMAVQSPGVLPQNINLIQTSLNPAALQQLVNPVVLTPGMISPHHLNQNQSLQIASQNNQGLKTEQLKQNTVSQQPANAQKDKVSGREITSTGNLQTPQAHVLGNPAQAHANMPNVSNDLKQVNAAALVKQLAASQLQTKLNTGNASVPDVKPILLQQQLNTPANQPAGLKVAAGNMMQSLSVTKPAVQLQGQVKVEGNKIVAGLSSSMPQTYCIVNTQANALTQPVHGPVANVVFPKPQTSAPAVPKVGTKTIAVNQITNEVVTQLNTNPTTAKQIQGANRVIAVNNRSNKIEDVYPDEPGPDIISANLGKPTLYPKQSPSVVIRPLKSPETVQNSVTGSQQKIMLFSIGGQLVTQQGVPVTLENGVLKLMPQAIVQIANQTLTPKQIQQTLAKISQATISPSNISSQQTSQPQSQADLAVTAGQSSVSLNSKNASGGQAITIAQTVSASEALNRDHTYETPTKFDIKGSHQNSDSSIPPIERKPRKSLSLDKELENRYVTVPNVTSTAGGSITSTSVLGSGSNSVQFVLKPMVYSTGYIVCPKMSGIASHAEEGKPIAGDTIVVGANVVKSENETLNFPPSANDSRTQLMKPERSLSLNGEKEITTNHDDPNGSEEEDLSEMPLVIDTTASADNDNSKRQGNHVAKGPSSVNINHGSHTDKEAALNLLRLANQALGSSDEIDEKDINSAGDATNKLGR